MITSFLTWFSARFRWQIPSWQTYRLFRSVLTTGVLLCVFFDQVRAVEAIPGALDSEFLPVLPTNTPVGGFVVQADGKVVVASGKEVSRLRVNGSLDVTFSSGIGVEGPIYQDSHGLSDLASLQRLALEADGKPLLAGVFTSVNGAELHNDIARLNLDGTVDNTFEPDPGNPERNPVLVVTPQVNWVLPLGDGKVMVAGEFGQMNGQIVPQVALLNPDGTLNPDFGFDPKMLQLPESGWGKPVPLAETPDGRILMFGDQWALAEPIAGTQSTNLLALVNRNGNLDSSFAPARLVLTFDGRSVLSSGPAAIQADGKVIITGPFDTVNGAPMAQIARLNADGSVDSSFMTKAAVNGLIHGLVVQSDGRILIAGEFDTVNGQRRIRVARLNADGALDATFDPGSGPDGPVRQIALQPYLGILISGDFQNVNGQSRPSLARLYAGSLADQIQLSNAKAAGGGGFTFSVLGLTTNAIDIQATEDLKHWMPVSTNLFLTSSNQLLTIPFDATQSYRFFRLQLH